MKLETVKLTDLVSDPNNARKHDEKNLEAIKGSLRQFGQRKPIVVQGNVVIAGNGTLEAAKQLGWDEIDIVQVPNDWTKDQAKAFALADNRTAELASWDEMVLAAQVIELKEAGIEVAEFGFEAIQPEPEIETTQDEIPEAPEVPVAKLGDIWQLGRHRVICGDSTDPATIDLLMQGEKAELVFTDPPYRMEAEGGSNQWVGRSAAKVGESIKEIIDFEPAAFLETLPSYFDKQMNTYIFCNKDLIPDYLTWANTKKYAFNLLFWKKPNALPLGGQHRPDVEYLLFFRKNAIWNNALPGVTYSRCLEFGRDLSTIHPTMKPLELITNELQISSNKDGIVVDPFGGSGSTLIGCEQTGRICRTIELDPKYVDVIVKRWENLTGQKAELVS
jgi:DNA modification methylase